MPSALEFTASIDVSQFLEEAKKIPSRIEADVGVSANDDSLVDVATYNEFGWVQRVTGKQASWLRFHGVPNARKNWLLSSPPRPFIRGTFSANAEDWKQQAEALIAQHGISKVRSVAQAVASIMRDDIKETIRNNGTKNEKFPDRSPITNLIYQATKSTYINKKGKRVKRKITPESGVGRSKALMLTGRLHDSIVYSLKEGK